MTRRTPLAGLALLASMLLTSCEKHDPAPPRRPATTSTAVGAIHGRALFIGAAPTPRPIDNHACHPGAKPIVDESVLVHPDGGLKNVVIYLKDAPSASPSTTQPAIDQVDCRYDPHVLAIQAGQKVIFKSSEPAAVAHNVHVASLGLNLSVTGPGALAPVKFDSPDFINVRCDVHPWMSCWIAVLDSPWFAVTDDHGLFEIKNVPTGTYTLTAWHERLPPLEQTVTINADVPSEVTFKYQAP